MFEIHITDLEQFSGCRLRWSWASMMRRGLQQAVLPEPLFLGQGVHVGLDAYHSSGHNPYHTSAVFKQWVIDRALAIKKHSGGLWGSERETINGVYRLGSQMLKHYHLWHSRFKLHERYEIVATEQRFKVPIPVMGESYASSILELAGRFDGIVRDLRDGKLWLLEFKTARSIKSSGWAMRGLQGTAYVWGARQMGYEVEGILYRILRKKIPDSIKMLQNGMYSQAKNQKTSLSYYMMQLKLAARARDMPIKDMYRHHLKMLRHLKTVKNEYDTEFFMQRSIRKPQALLRSAMRAVYEVGLQMASTDTPVYAIPGWNTCNSCPFRDPCDLMQLGMEDAANDLLEAEYAPRGYWES